MAKIKILPDCGNAPRKLFLKNVIIANANGDFQFFDEVIPEDIEWDLVGKKVIYGKEKYLKELQNQKGWEAIELVVDTIITHGAYASASGQFKSADSKIFYFSNIYKFNGAGGLMIRSITTFVIREA